MRNTFVIDNERNVDGEFIAFDDEEDDKTFFVLLFLCKLRN